MLCNCTHPRGYEKRKNMDAKNTKNTLFLGNGFSRTVFKNIPSWQELFGTRKIDISNNTILYEIFRLNKMAQKEEDLKAQLINNIKLTFSEKNINDGICDLERFGEYLKKYNIYNIITTNYDNGIEFILCDLCGYIEKKSENMVAERIYSVRTYREFEKIESGHTVKLWKIHGDVSRIQSVMLGFDQYCGSLSKLMSYVKGQYKTSQSEKKAECKISMQNKCSNREFDHLSWAELFFCTNVYIVGFGMDFSEIDVWWLLNKRARFMTEVEKLNNKITYLYNEAYDGDPQRSEKFIALQAFQVLCHPITSGSNYINDIFKKII